MGKEFDGPCSCFALHIANNKPQNEGMGGKARLGSQGTRFDSLDHEWESNLVSLLEFLRNIKSS
jgi:hypothetical protein